VTCLQIVASNIGQGQSLRKGACGIDFGDQGRYASAGRPEKAKILDEFVALTGFHRKHAMRC
jgi:hypothetical protein